MDEVMREFLTESAENIAALDQAIVDLEQRAAAARGSPSRATWSSTSRRHADVRDELGRGTTFHVTLPIDAT